MCSVHLLFLRSSISFDKRLYLFLSSKELTIFAYYTTMKNTPFDTVFYTKVIANRTWVLELKGLV